MKTVNLNKTPVAHADTYVCILAPRSNAEIMLTTMAKIRAVRLASRAS